MAVATTNAFSGPFTANGVTTTFPFTFTVLSGADVAVALRDADGVETAVTSGFTVTLAGDAPASGSVVFDTAPASGNEVWLYLDPAFTQETEFADGHPFLAGAVNNVNDLAALRDQVLRRDVDRSPMVPIGEMAPEMASLTGQDGKVLGVVGGKIIPVENDVVAAADYAAASAASAVESSEHADASEAARLFAEAAQFAAEQAESGAIGAALTATGYYPGARSHVPRGMTAVTITAAGSGGTDGTYTCPLTGDNLSVDAFATVTVSGGAVTAVSVAAPGLYIGASPTAGTVDTSAITGLTGATLTPTIGFLRTSGQYYLTDHASDAGQVALFQNQAGSAVEVDASVDWLNIGRSQSWAEGTLPGGAGTKSAKEWSEVTEGFAQSSRFGSGNLLSVLATVGRQVNNGAALSGSFGINFPAGIVGNASMFQPRYLFVAAGRVGQIIEVRLGFDQSVTFTRAFLSPAMNVITAANPSGINRTSTVTTSVTGTRRIVTFRYTLQGDETALQPILVTTTGAATTVAESLTLTDYVLNYVTSSSDILSAGDQILRDNLERLTRAAVDDDYLFTLGNQASESIWVGQLFNGATRSGYTITVPNGSTGQTTLIHYRLAFDGAANTGRRVRFTIGYDLSGTFTRTFANPTFQVATAANPNGVSRVPASSVVTTVGNRRIYTVEFIVQGDEIALLPFQQFNSATQTDSAESITLAHWSLQYLTALTPLANTQDETLAVREAATRNRGWEPAAAYNNSPAAAQQEVRTVAPSGGDFTTPNAALAGITDAQPWKRYRVNVEPGIYTGGEFFDKDYVDFQGRNPAECRFRLFQPNNTTAANISLFSAMYMLRNSRLDGLTIECRNARYAIHLESGNGAPNRLQEIINCEVLHFGNDDAPANTWVAQYAVGSGLSSGQHVRVRGGRFWGKNTGAFYYHTNVDYAHPSIVDIEGAELSTDATNGSALVAVAMGSFVRDRCRLVGNILGGDIRYLTTPWLQTPLNKQPANHAEIDMYGHGNSPAVFRITDFGRALMIQSATTGSGSSVTVGGDAVPLIFGDGTAARTFGRAGSAGFAAQVWGWGDVSDVAVGPAQNVQITALGKRLGDCTSVNRTLTVTVDGGSPITITFNQNYTAQSNATILAAINAALGSAATASLFAPGERYRPHFADEEFTGVNTSGSGIPFGTVCAYDTTHRTIRPMTSTDPASRFAGVAWEDIAAGTSGRIKSGGYLPISDILRTGSGSFAFGDTFSIDPSNPGRIVNGGSQGLFPAIRSDAVRVA